MTDRFLFHHTFSASQSVEAMAQLWQRLQQLSIMPLHFSESELRFVYHLPEVDLAALSLLGSAAERTTKLEVQARLLVEAKPLAAKQALSLYQLVNQLTVINLSYLAPLVNESAVWVFELAQAAELAENDLTQLAAELGTELNLLHGQLPMLSEPGVLLMDMDSTAIQIECIDEIARLAGVGDEVAEVTELAMQGKLDFEESLRQRVAKLKGVQFAQLETILQQLPLTDGLRELVDVCQQAGWKVGIASGGFTYFAQHLQTSLGLDEAQANQLLFDGDTLTGAVEGRVVDARFKADMLLSMCDKYAIPQAQSVAIGDGANDLPMLSNAGLGVAFHAKPVVAAQAAAAVRFGGLQQVLPLLRCSIKPVK